MGSSDGVKKLFDTFINIYMPYDIVLTYLPILQIRKIGIAVDINIQFFQYRTVHR